MTVEWREIPGYSRYLVSSDGVIVRKCRMYGISLVTIYNTISRQRSREVA